jgi:hypothetical protein
MKLLHRLYIAAVVLFFGALGFESMQACTTPTSQAKAQQAEGELCAIRAQARALEESGVLPRPAAGSMRAQIETEEDAFCSARQPAAPASGESNPQMTRPRLSPNGPEIDLTTQLPQTFHHVAGADETIDWSKGPNQQIDLSAATCVVTSTGLPQGETASLTLMVQQDATGGRAIAFVGGQTPGGTPLALSAGANATDLLDLFWTGHVLLVTIRGKAFA